MQTGSSKRHEREPRAASHHDPGAVTRGDGFRLGATATASTTRFAVYTTTARDVVARIFDANGDVRETIELSPRGDGLFEADAVGLGPGTLYKFVLDGRELPDPYARYLPDGVHGAALVAGPAQEHELRHPGVSRPLREHVIYELHIGTFTEEGTYAAARARLPDLVDLGVTAIELLPLAAFAGTRGWGYDGVSLFAPFAPYGTPGELRELVDAAHGLGLAVFLDVVYNHFGPAGNYLREYSPDYFTDRFKNAWGDSPNFAHPVVREMVVSNALHWLEEYRFDGLRLDAVHAITDTSPRHILRELAQAIGRLSPKRLLIAEDERNDPGTVVAHGLDAIWADDFHHAVRVTLTGESDGYYSAYPPGAVTIARAISSGWLYTGEVYPPSGTARGKPARELPAEAFVYCIQNHDQVGNRAFGDRLNAVVPLDAYLAASTLLLFLPMTPLIFMGQEWAASTPFQFFTDHEPELGKKVSEGRREEFKAFNAVASGGNSIPDPQALGTFARSKLRWEERDIGEHRRVHALYRTLLRLRRQDPVLASSGRDALEARAHGAVLEVRRWSPAGQRRLLVSFSASPAPIPPGLSNGSAGKLLFATGDWRPAEVGADAGREHLPPYAAVILAS